MNAHKGVAVYKRFSGPDLVRPGGGDPFIHPTLSYVDFLSTLIIKFFSCAATLHVIMFFFCLSHPSKYELTSPKTNSQVHIQTHKTILDLIWLNVLRNSCTVPYLFFSSSFLFVPSIQIRTQKSTYKLTRHYWI